MGRVLALVGLCSKELATASRRQGCMWMPKAMVKDLGVKEIVFSDLGLGLQNVGGVSLKRGLEVRPLSPIRRLW